MRDQYPLVVQESGKVELIAWKPDMPSSASHQCGAAIRLDGTVYVCRRRFLHTGIHDANFRHSDGYLVRW